MKRPGSPTVPEELESLGDRSAWRRLYSNYSDAELYEAKTRVFGFFSALLKAKQEATDGTSKEADSSTD